MHSPFIYLIPTLVYACLFPLALTHGPNFGISGHPLTIFLSSRRLHIDTLTPDTENQHRSLKSYGIRSRSTTTSAIPVITRLPPSLVYLMLKRAATLKYTVQLVERLRAVLFDENRPFAPYQIHS